MYSAATRLLPRLLLRHRVDEPLFIFCRALAAATLLQVPVVPTEALLLSALLPWGAVQTRHWQKSKLGTMAGFALLAAEMWLLMGILPQMYLPYLCLAMLLLGTLSFRNKTTSLLRSVFYAVLLAQCSLAPAYGFSFLYSPVKLMVCQPAALSALLLFCSVPVQKRFLRKTALPKRLLRFGIILLQCLCVAEAYYAASFERPLFLWILAESLMLTAAELLRFFIPRAAVWADSYLPLILAETAVILCR